MSRQAQSFRLKKPELYCVAGKVSDGDFDPGAGQVISAPDLSKATYGTLLRLLWRHIQPRRRVQVGLLVVLMLLSSLAELLTIASLVPFLVALSDPAGLCQPWVRSAAEGLGLGGPQQLILPITLLLMAASVVSAAIRAANLSVNARLSALIASDLGVEVYRRTLEQPYVVHLGRNSSEVITLLAYLGGISRGCWRRYSKAWRALSLRWC
jgi:hypothetical protein